jgi:hypothetical protein
MALNDLFGNHCIPIIEDEDEDGDDSDYDYDTDDD